MVTRIFCNKHTGFYIAQRSFLWLFWTEDFPTGKYCSSTAYKSTYKPAVENFLEKYKRKYNEPRATRQDS